MSGKGGHEIDRMAVKITHLDRLLSLTGEIIITASNMSILQRHVQSQNRNLDKDTMEMIKNASLTSNRISSDLHHLVMDIRLIPIRETFLRFRRLVRDLAKKKGRQVDFEIVGEETLVDKTVAEKLYEPLAHQIRNAVDHGLEDPVERKHSGKNPTGQLTLTAYKKEGFTYVSVSDDGRGLEETRIRQAAVEKGVISASAVQELSREESFALIMQPGFSTAREATEISGRGVGMDVVKSTVEELGGEVQIESALGQGTTFVYKIPQLSAVNITDALIIRAGEEYFAVPIGNVVATQAFSEDEFFTAMESGQGIIYLNSIIPLHDLRELLSGTPLDEGQDAAPVIIVEAKNGRIALRVSEFIRPQKLVLIPMPEIFSVKGISGATILGGSQLGLVLEPFELISLATGRTLESDEDAFLSRASVSMGDEAPAEEQPVVETPAQKAAEVEFEAAAPAPKVNLEMDENMAAEFFHEIQEILKELNEEIFQLEKDPENSRRINTIFRHYHSIKGNFLMTGFKELGTFVHQVETVLDRIRDKELEVNQEIIDLLLDAVRLLEKALAEIRGGRIYEIRDQELLEALEKYRRQEVEVQEEEEQQQTFTMSGLSRLLLQAKQARGANVFQSLIKFKPRFQEPGLAAYLILRRIAILGDVIDTVPSLDKIEKNLVSDTFKLLFATSRSQEEVDRFMEKQLKRYYEVTVFENLLME